MNDQQPVLFQGPEDDNALLLPAEERRKRYTASQAAELERLHAAVMMLLACWPVEAIARELNLNTRTVRALAARDAEKVAGLEKGFADILLRTGARWIALARTREHEASFRDLNIGAGILMDHARALAMMGQVEGEAATKEVQDHAEAAAALRALMAPGEVQSTEETTPVREIEQGGAGPEPEPAPGPDPLAPPGGGPGGRPEPDSPIPLREGSSESKGPSGPATS